VNNTNKFFIITILLILTSHLVGQEKPPPESLLEDAQGRWEMFVTGSWSLDFLLGLGLGFADQGDVYFQNLPSFGEGFLFKQVPDFTASLRVYDRFIAEVSYLGGYQDNTFLLGWEGDPEELLQEVYLGNTQIDMESYASQSTNQQVRSSPGLKWKTLGEAHQWESVLRYSPGQTSSLRFLGTQKISQATLDPTEYKKGQYFFLPDSEVDLLQILIESPSGKYKDPSNGETYKVLTAEEYQYRPESNRLLFPDKITGRILVYYEKEGLPLGDTALGQKSLPEGIDGVINLELTRVDFNWDSLNTPYLETDQTGRQIQLTKEGVPTGKDYYLLYSPQLFNPFELKNIYPMSSLEAKSFRVFPKGHPEETLVELSSEKLLQTEGVLLQTPQDPRYPLGEIFPQLYSPGEQLYSPYSIAWESSQQSRYFLGNKVVPQSLQVYINGKMTEKFQFDPGTGELTFSQVIFPDDVIDVLFITETSQRETGSLYGSTGLRLQLTENLSLEGSLQGQQSLDNKDYSDYQGEHSAYLKGALQARYQKDNWHIQVTPQVLQRFSDTTGLYRFDGFQQRDSLYSYGWGENLPGSKPKNSFRDSLDLLIELSPSERGSLLYKDYSYIDEFGVRIVNSYNSTAFSLEGSKTGPYLAYGDSQNPYVLNVLDFELAPGETWVGSQHFLNPYFQGEGLTTIQLDIRNITPPPGGKVFLQLGALSEDINNNGILDTTLELEGRTFGSSFQKGEDFDDDGLLKQSERFVSWELTQWDPNTTDWQGITLSLTNDQRALLKGANSFRIFYVDQEGTQQRGGTIAITPIRFLYQDSLEDIKGAESRLIREESLNLSNDLQILYPQKSAIPSPVDNTLWYWQKGDTAQANSRYIFSQEMPLKEYDNIQFYLYLLNPLGADQGITVRFFDTMGQDMTYEIDPQSLIPFTWNEVTIETGLWPFSSQPIGFEVSADFPDPVEILIDEIFLTGIKTETSMRVDYQGKVDFTPLFSWDHSSILPNTVLEWSGSYRESQLDNSYQLNMKWPFGMNSLTLDQLYNHDHNSLDLRSDSTLFLIPQKLQLTDRFDSRGSHYQQAVIQWPQSSDLQLEKEIQLFPRVDRKLKGKWELETGLFQMHLKSQHQSLDLLSHQEETDTITWQETAKTLWDYQKSYNASYNSTQWLLTSAPGQSQISAEIAHQINIQKKAPFSQSSQHDLKWDLPIVTNWGTLRSYYQKTLKTAFRYNNRGEITPFEEAGGANWLRYSPVFLTNWFGELYYKNPEAQFSDTEVLYTPRGGLGYTRDISFSPWELILPNRLDFSFHSKLNTYEEQETFSKGFTLEATINSINLLGRQGHWLKLPFFLTDIQNHGFKVDVNQDSQQFSGSHNINIQINDSAQIHYNSDWSSENQELTDLSSQFEWVRSQPYTNRRILPIIPRSLIETQSLKHSEKWELHWSPQESLQSWIGHKTKIVFAKSRGNITLYADIGYQKDQEITYFGLRSGIQCLIQY